MFESTSLHLAAISVLIQGIIGYRTEIVIIVVIYATCMIYDPGLFLLLLPR